MKSIITTYHGPTDFKGSRIKATDGDNTVWVSYNNGSSDPHRDAALKLCRKLNWKGKLICGGTKTGKVFVFLPIDLELAHKGRTCSDVLDLSMTDEQIAEYGKME